MNSMKDYLVRMIPDELYLRLVYRKIMGKRLELNPPKTFNEKIQWLKLYDRQKIYTTLVDKYAAKSYVAGIIGDEHIIPTLGVWDRFDDINFDELPEKFVLKCTHDSGSVVICKNKIKFDYAEARTKLNKGLSTNFYWQNREWPYRFVPRRIIAEEYLEDNEDKDSLIDYKVYCFNGEPRTIQIISDRFSSSGMTNDYYSVEWKNLGIRKGNDRNSEVLMERPKCLNEIIELAEQLSKGYLFVRIDLYYVKQRIYFGEFTLYPASGLKPFKPEEYDFLFGSWIDLTRSKKIQ